MIVKGVPVKRMPVTASETQQRNRRKCTMILVRASAGLVIELSVSESGKWDTLSVRLAEGLSPEPFRFEVSSGTNNRLRVRPLEARDPAELVSALGAILRYQDNILAEVRKYGGA
jgi:hypothetical protein